MKTFEKMGATDYTTRPVNGRLSDLFVALRSEEGDDAIRLALRPRGEGVIYLTVTEARELARILLELTED